MASSLWTGILMLALAAAQSGPLSDDEGQSREADGVFTAVLQGEEGMEILTYEKVGPLAVTQGDIDIGDHADLQQETLRNLQLLTRGLDRAALGPLASQLDAHRRAAPAGGALGPGGQVGISGLGVTPDRPWPSRTLVYQIDPSVTDADLKRSIADAARIWTAGGAVTVRPATTADVGVRPLIIKSSSELGKDPSKFYCSSKVGYVTTNRMFLSNACRKYSVVHEFGHALGLHHEHARADRGGALKVDMSRIKAEYRDQYGTVAGNYHGTAHDLCSLMHYGPSASGRATTTGASDTWYTLTQSGAGSFATCAAALRNQGDCGTSAPKSPGQRCAVSAGDRVIVAAMYSAGAP